MNVLYSGLAAALAVMVSAVQAAEPAANADTEQIESITVYGHADTLQGPELDAARSHHGNADAARLFELLPGANTNENGAISGQIQYRGLFGPRTDVRVNGLGFPSGGPNWMDPPMHYVPPGLIGSIALHRGISSVSNKNIGGHAEAQWKRPEYGARDSWQPYLDIDTNLRSNDSGYGVAATFGLSNSQQRFYVTANDESGDDYEADGNSVNGTEFQRQAYGAGYGWSGDRWFADAAYYRIETDDAGTPSLPLDIGFFRTDLWHLQTGTLLGPGEFKVSVGGSDIDHGMHNFSLRPAPDFSSLPLPPFAGDDRRQVRVSSESLELRLSYDMPLADGVWSTGVDYNTEEHSARVTDPDFAPFFVDNINNAEQDSTALYSTWLGEVRSGTQLEVGLRVTRAETDSDPVDAFPAQLVDANPAAWPMGTPPRAVFVLRERFNNSDREQSDTLLDWVLKVNQDLPGNWNMEAGVARKTRLPIYLERYLWIPLEVNAGLGDGNNYVGNPDLDPEVSHQVELAFGWQNEHGYLSPRFFFHRVDDFIQGVAVTDMVTIAVSANANGDPTPLMFANVDAELYGLDMGFGWRLAENWRVDGNLAWLRGRRTDEGDNLYRLAPPSLRLALTWLQPRWQVTLEHLAYARQDNLSRTISDDPASGANNFNEVPGYGIFNLYANLDLSSQWSVNVGLENLADKDYLDPLSGFNRNAAAGVPVGERLPGRGRNAFLRVNFRL